MKRIIVLLILCPVFAFSQRYENLDSASKVRVDSLTARIRTIAYSMPHHRMVSFSEWSVDMMSDFWKYLIHNLNYKTEQPNNTVNVVKTKTGFYAKFYKISSDNSQTKQTLRVDFLASSKEDNIQQARISGPPVLLKELFTSYFGGNLKQDVNTQLFLNRVYTITDEVTLYENYIMIKGVD
ncbi:hypothetical protein ACI6Q2_23085 [Chitinophagaceae bacterium LWZ2-11]